MRSAEPSGVTAKSVFASKNSSREALRPAGSFADEFRRAGTSISPVTLGVAATGFGAALLFTGYDLIRSAAEAQAVAASGAPAAEVLSGVWERAIVAFALALLIAALAFRRRTGSKAAAQAKQTIADIVAAIPFGVALWSESGRLVSCNDLYLQQLDGDGLPLTPGRTYGEAVKQLTAGAVVEVVRDGDSRRLMELRRSDGECLLIDERPMDGGGFVTFVTDITERKRADHLLSAVQQEQRLLARRYHEEKLKAEAASRAKTSFLAHLSHDIRTPLNHIIGFADLIRHQTYGPLGDARYLAYLDMIKGSGEKLLGSFAEILDLAEFESGSKALREEIVSVDDLLGAVTRRFSAQAARAGLALALGAPCGGELYADRFCLERMLGNLVENAIRFTPSGGRVVVAGYAAEDGVVLEVSDTGIGMNAEQLGRLSQPFVFGDAAFAREHDGAGLGIAISRAIAELSGGRLAIDSSPTLGTTVAIALPIRGTRGSQVEAA